MNVVPFTHREFLILFYVSMTSILVDGYIGDRLYHDIHDGIDLPTHMLMFFLLMSTLSCLVLVLAFLDFRPKANIIIAKTLLWGPVVFILGLVSLLSFLVTVFTTLTVMWTLVKSFI